MAKKIKEQETFQIDTEEITKSIKEDILHLFKIMLNQLEVK